MADKSTKELVTYDSILAALSGLDEDTGTMEDLRISIVGCFRAFNELSKEFPQDFPDLFFSKRSGIPYSKELEDTLFQLGAWRLIQDNNPDYRYFTVTKETRKLIREQLKKYYGGEEELREHFSPIAKLFKELLQRFERIEPVSV